MFQVYQKLAAVISKDTAFVVKCIKGYQPNLNRKKDICLAAYGNIVTELEDVVSSKNTECQSKRPQGFLLLGPPGVGKTSLVAYLAECWHAELFILNGADVFRAHMGQSEKNLRKIFEKARLVPTVGFSYQR